MTVGLRQTREWKDNETTRRSSFVDGSPLTATGNTTADAIRAAQTGANFGPIQGVKIQDDSTAWLFNPSYQLTDDVLLYTSASSGEKSGAVAFDNNGNPANVEPEKTRNYELGIKSQLLNRRVTLNANLYYTKVRDYQNVTSEADPGVSDRIQLPAWQHPGVRARGLEFDAAFRVTQYLEITSGGAFNDAIYTDWHTATCPRSVPTTVAFCDNTGRQIVGAPRWTGIVGFNYEQPFIADYAAHLFGNFTYRSKHNLEQLLSPYGEQKAYGLTDFGAGLTRGTANAQYELNVIAKNVFDTKYTTSVNDFSNSAPVGYDGIGARRYVGVILSARF